jgi:hypothetical protein
MLGNYRVVHKSLGDFRSLRMVTTGGGGGSKSTAGETHQVSVVLLGTWPEISFSPSQLMQFCQIPRHRTFSYPLFRHDCPLAVKPASTPRRLLPKKLGEILYLLICSFLLCLSWLLRCRVRKFQRDLRITLCVEWRDYIAEEDMCVINVYFVKKDNEITFACDTCNCYGMTLVVERFGVF